MADCLPNCGWDGTRFIHVPACSKAPKLGDRARQYDPEYPMPEPICDELSARAAITSTYPCEKCGRPRTKAEGGTTLTVCDGCPDYVKAWAEAADERDRFALKCDRLKQEIEALKAEGTQMTEPTTHPDENHHINCTPGEHIRCLDCTGFICVTMMSEFRRGLYLRTRLCYGCRVTREEKAR